jgi:hypothetical protein
MPDLAHGPRIAVVGRGIVVWRPPVSCGARG